MRNPKAIDLDLTDLGNPLAANLLRWQSLWVALVEHPWCTLAVVPVGHESLASDVVTHLLTTARDLGQIVYSVREPGETGQTRSRCIMCTAPPLQFPGEALAARSADAVILVVSLEHDTVTQVQRVRNMIGTPRILGCVVANRPRPTAGAKHGVLNHRGGRNVQPANGVGAAAGGPFASGPVSGNV